MSSSTRPFSRDEATAISPLRNAFATSSSKPLHSPFLTRRPRTGNGNQYDRLNSPSNEGMRQPDATSTSSSTLVNAESTSDYRPWEVRSDSNSTSLDSLARSHGGRATPTLLALDDIGTLPSIHISPLPRRPTPRTNRAAIGSARISNDSTRPSTDLNSTRTFSSRQLCPADCRCSDQDIDLGLCRRVVTSSSSGSESGSMSVGVHQMTPRAADAIITSSSEPAVLDADMETRNAVDVEQADRSQRSLHSQSDARSQARDFEKHPILIPRSVRPRARDGGARSPNSSYQRSFDQLQRGLDTLESNESDADSDADQAHAVQRRAESMARWTARRSSLSQSNVHPRSPASNLDSALHSPTLPNSTPIHSTARPLASDSSLSRRTPALKLIDDEKSARSLSSSSPLKATPGRKSIAAVFESMQKEREARAAEEHRQWQEKQARRERERAARAFGVPLRRRTSTSSSQLGGTGSTSLGPDTPLSQGQTTEYLSTFSKASPSRSPAASVVSVSPLLSSPRSPKVDDGIATEVRSRHLGEEAAGSIPETLAEADETDGKDEDLKEASPSEGPSTTVQQGPATTTPTTPPTKHMSAFGFASQPMALDVSPIRSISDVSSPASSPRKNAHRRQNTNTVSVAARLPSTSIVAARQRLNHVLGHSTAEISAPDKQAEGGNRETTQMPHPQTPHPQTPIGGILSSTKKGLASLSAARRGHSVRFSPRPDYRSDSGSWDETQSVNANDGDESRDAAVSRLVLPAKQITIPEMLATASLPVHVPSANEEEQQASESSVESVGEHVTGPQLPVESPVSQPHTPASPVGLRSANNSVATSFSQSVRFPGAYTATPIKSYSRHLIRPSPKIERVPTDVVPAAVRAAPTTVTRDFGLFPALDLDSASSIPRESTPPPCSTASKSCTPQMLPADDPRNSPRSPRRVDLSRDRVGHSNADSDSSNSSAGKGPAARQVDANTGANEHQRGKQVEVDATISKILETVQATHSSKLRRMQLGDRLNGIDERMRKLDVASAQSNRGEGSVRFEPGVEQAKSKRARLEEEFDRQDEQDQGRMDELKSNVIHALGVLADRIIQLEAINASSLVDSGTTRDVASITSRTHGLTRIRNGLSRRTTVLLVLLQCAIMACLLSVAEQKAQRMRMFNASRQLALLYRTSPNIEWNAPASDPHLEPLLHIPLLHQLYTSFPPLPSPHPVHPHTSPANPWHNYTTYIHLNGLTTFMFQLAVYAVSQSLACVILLIIAPLQVVWIVLHNPNAPHPTPPAFRTAL